MNNQELSDQEILDALQAWKSQQSQSTESIEPVTEADYSGGASTPQGKPSLTEILAREGLIDSKENSGQLDPTILQVILDL